MIYVLTVLHIIVSLVLIGVVLLQTGKRADLAGAFGGGGSQTAFGTRGAATLLSKATTGAAIMFMITSIGLSILSAKGTASDKTVLGDDPIEASVPAPTVPGSEAPADLPPLLEETPIESSESPVDDSTSEPE